MTLSQLEAGLKRRAMAAFALEEGALAGFHLAAPPPHIDADVSIAWPIAAAKLLRKPPLKIAEELAAAIHEAVHDGCGLGPDDEHRAAAAAALRWMNAKAARHA